MLPILILTEPLWWFIQWVNLTGPRSVRLCGQTLFWVLLRGCSWMRLILNGSTEEQIALSNVGGPHGIKWRLNRTKRLNPNPAPPPRENSSCLMAFQLRCWFSLPLDLNWMKHWLFLPLEPAILGPGASSPGSPVADSLCRSWDLPTSIITRAYPF